MIKIVPKRKLERVVEIAAPLIPYFGIKRKFRIILKTDTIIKLVKSNFDFPIAESRLEGIETERVAKKTPIDKILKEFSDII